MQPKLRDPRLYWRGGRIWCRVPDAGGFIVRRTTKCKSEAAASARADELERRFADPDHAAAATATLGGIVKALVADLRRRKRSDAYIEIIEQKLGHFLRLWKPERVLADVNAPLVLEYIDQRQREGASDHTIKMEMGKLSLALKLARYLGVFQVPNERLFPPFFTAGYKPKERAPTLVEMQKLFRALEPRRAAHLAWMIATGARLAESQRARRSDVDWARRVVRMRGSKTDASKAEIPVTALMAKMLEWSLANAPGAELLFAPWGKLHRDVGAACVRAEIPYATPNDFRRSFGTWHREAGVDVNTTSKLLRHTTDKLAQTTYARIGGEVVGRLVKKQLENVPELYAVASESDPKRLLPAHETSEKAVPAAEVESATNALGRPSQSLGTNAQESPRSRGNRFAWARRKESQNVPSLYPAAHQNFPGNSPTRAVTKGEASRPAWLHEATANLYELLAAGAP